MRPAEEADPPSLPPAGVLLGVDYGQKRVGLAVCDEGQSIAVPLALYERRKPEVDAAYFRDLAKQQRLAGLVVGLPLHMKSGDEGEAAKAARRFGAWLVEATHMPIAFIDERLTTSLAHRLLIDAGVKASRRKDKIDKLAAQILLQTYLDERAEARRGAQP